MTTSKTHALQLVVSNEPADEPAAEADLPLDITVRPGTDIHGVALVLLTGQIHADSAPRVRAAIEKLVNHHRRYIVVDLDEVTFSDAQSYEGLVEATCSAVQRDATVLFTSDPRCVLLLKVEDPEP